MSESAIDVHWLECRRDDLPKDDRWLAKDELSILQAFRIPKRSDDWRLGRWTAKQAVAAYLGLSHDPESLAAIEIRAALSGAPEAFLGGDPAPVSISISHSKGVAACAVTQDDGVIGCDLEEIVPHSDAFVADYFVASEQALLADSPVADRPWLTTLLWSAKESALKALHEGLRLDTRSVQAQPRLGEQYGQGWQPLTVTDPSGRSLKGWWRSRENLIHTLISEPSPKPPIVRTETCCL